MKNNTVRNIRTHRGQTVVEYALLLSLLALVAIAVITLLGRKTNEVFNETQNALQTETF